MCRDLGLRKESANQAIEAMMQAGARCLFLSAFCQDVMFARLPDRAFTGVQSPRDPSPLVRVAKTRRSTCIKQSRDVQSLQAVLFRCTCVCEEECGYRTREAIADRRGIVA